MGHADGVGRWIWTVRRVRVLPFPPFAEPMPQGRQIVVFGGHNVRAGTACRVELSHGQVVETPLEARFIG